MDKKTFYFFMGFLACAALVFIGGSKDFYQTQIEEINWKLDRNYKLIKRHFYYSFMCHGCPLDFVNMQMFMVGLTEAARLGE